MDSFKLTTLGKEIVCELYGFEENTIYRKSWIELFKEIAKKIMLYRGTLCTIVSTELTINNLVQRFEKENLTGLRLQHIFKICDTTWLVDLITMLNYKNVNQVILIDMLQVNKISELKQIDSYCKRHDISLIIREQVPLKDI